MAFDDARRGNRTGVRERHRTDVVVSRPADRPRETADPTDVHHRHRTRRVPTPVRRERARVPHGTGDGPVPAFVRRVGNREVHSDRRIVFASETIADYFFFYLSRAKKRWQILSRGNKQM